MVWNKLLELAWKKFLVGSGFYMPKVDTTFYIRREKKTCSLFKTYVNYIIFSAIMSIFAKNFSTWWRNNSN